MPISFNNSRLSSLKNVVTYLLFACIPIWLSAQQQTYTEDYNITIKVGAELTEQYLPLIKGKSIAIVANQTSMIGQTHLVDSLLALKCNIQKIFTLEHGFRGIVDAGASIKDSIDKKTRIPMVSLYGAKKMPDKNDVKGIQLITFDIQDVGVRFYTYISSLHYIMQCCADNDIELLVLDRPNPNGFYVDGPILESHCHSFVGMHPVAMVHGMTLGEYASMINCEGWLEGKKTCKLTVIKVSGYEHKMRYVLPVKPSPNLPNMNSVYLYPSLGLFEGTCISVGRGTDKPFQVFGHPSIKTTDYSFIPKSIPGAALHPPFQDTLCYGYNVGEFGGTYIKNNHRIYLFWLMELYKQFTDKKHFFNPYFSKLAGTKTLQKQIEQEVSEETIYKSWSEDLTKFKKIRKKYLLYTDFE
jgi:uncharacterized protein YbbC (DUF1343 family)